MTRGRWYAWTAGDCKDMENLTVPKPLRTGTGVIRKELLINSLLSTPQAQCGKHFAWSARKGFCALRVSIRILRCPLHTHVQGSEPLSGCVGR